jgi:aspartate kinase
MEKVVVSGIAYTKNESRVTITNVPDQPGVAARVFQPISAANINVDLIVQGASGIPGKANISFTVPKTSYNQTIGIVESIAPTLGDCQVLGEPGIAKVSIVGIGMRSNSGVAVLMFETLARENINIKMIATSEIKISCIMDEKYTELAVRVLHDAFALDRKSKDAGNDIQIQAKQQ